MEPILRNKLPQVPSGASRRNPRDGDGRNCYWNTNPISIGVYGRERSRRRCTDRIQGRRRGNVLWDGGGRHDRNNNRRGAFRWGCRWGSTLCRRSAARWRSTACGRSAFCWRGAAWGSTARGTTLFWRRRLEGCCFERDGADGAANDRGAVNVGGRTSRGLGELDNLLRRYPRLVSATLPSTCLGERSLTG